MTDLNEHLTVARDRFHFTKDLTSVKRVDVDPDFLELCEETLGKDLSWTVQIEFFAISQAIRRSSHVSKDET